MKLLLLLQVILFAAEGPEKYYNRGIESYLRGNLSEAIVDLREVLKLAPEHKEAKAFLVKVLVERATQLYSIGELNESLSHLKEAYELNPQNKEIVKMYKIIKQEVTRAKALPPSTTPQTVQKLSDIGRYDILISLFNNFQKEQTKLISELVGSKKMMQEQILTAEKERKKLLEMQMEEREKMFKILQEKDMKIAAMLEQQRRESQRNFLFIVLVGALSLGVILFFLFTFFRYISARREALLMRHQEQILNILASSRPVHELKSKPIDRYLPKKHRSRKFEPDKKIWKKEVERMLTPFLHNPNNRIRANAVRALYDVNPDKAMEVVKEMLHSPNKWMRMSGIWVVGEVKDEKGLDYLLDISRDESDSQVKNRICISLSKFLETREDILPPEKIRRIREVLSRHRGYD